MDYDSIPSEDVVNKTAEALKANKFNVHVVSNAEEAKAKALELIPEGSEVMTMTSKTIEQIGLLQELNESGKYKSVRAHMNTLDRATQKKEMDKVGGVHEFTVVSAHAVTQDGKLVWASNSASQIPGISYGADKVIVIASTKKITKDLEEGINRINEHVLPLESVRAHEAYGVDRSYVNQLLIMNTVGLFTPGRVEVILVNEKLGF